MRSTVYNGRVQHMDFAVGDTVGFSTTVVIGDNKVPVVKGHKVTRGDILVGVQKCTKQVCIERDVPVQRNGKFIPHCCKAEKKTEEELFFDEMLAAAGKKDQVAHTHSQALTLTHTLSHDIHTLHTIVVT